MRIGPLFQCTLCVLPQVASALSLTEVSFVQFPITPAYASGASDLVCRMTAVVAPSADHEASKPPLPEVVTDSGPCQSCLTSPDWVAGPGPAAPAAGAPGGGRPAGAGGM